MKRPTIYGVVLALAVLALFTKFFWSYWHFHQVPLGYDVGLYRYLFIKHAEAFPPFVLGDVQDWAKDHPLGLFIIFTPLIKLGLPVDWVIGWIWNLIAASLVLFLAWAISRSPAFLGKHSSSRALFLATIVMGTLSIPLYDGFAYMYYKAIVSLLFVVLAFMLLEKNSPWAALPAVFALITHNQTGLLFVLAAGTWWMYEGYRRRMDKSWRKITLWGVIALVVSLLVYLPIFHEAIGKNIATLLLHRGGDVPSGAFQSLSFYFPRYKIAIALAVMGVLVQLRREKALSPWHFAVLWSAIFYGLQLFFYSRFLLDLDFFLIPFSAYFIVTVCRTWRRSWVYFVCVVLVLVQGTYLYLHMQVRIPRITWNTYQALQQLPSRVPQGVTVAGYEHETALWLRGWLPNTRVIAPGFFEPVGTSQDWEDFLTLDNHFRKILLGGMPHQMYFFLPDEFFLVHGEAKAMNLVNDPCFVQSADLPELWMSVCSPKS